MDFLLILGKLAMLEDAAQSVRGIQCLVSVGGEQWDALNYLMNRDMR